MNSTKLPMVASRRRKRTRNMCKLYLLKHHNSIGSHGHCRQKDEEEDVVDSDFSIDENDEPISDHDEELGKKRKRAGINTKAYKVRSIDMTN